MTRPSLAAARLAAGLLAIVLLPMMPAPAAPAGGGIAGLWQGLRWGEPDAAVAGHFGAAATRLPRALDFGDAYVDLVLRDRVIGGFPFVVYFQMDKRGGGLKRIQIERPRHGVNPPAFRAALAELGAAYGAPDRSCALPPSPASGYQATVERLWRRDDATVRAVFRDTTLEASEGCFSLVAGGPCGLTGQLIIRISPPGRDIDTCG